MVSQLDKTSSDSKTSPDMASSAAWIDDTDSLFGRAMRLAGKPLEAGMQALPEEARGKVSQALVTAFEKIVDGSGMTVNAENIQSKTADDIAAREEAARGETAEQVVAMNGAGGMGDGAAEPAVLDEGSTQGSDPGAAAESSADIDLDARRKRAGLYKSRTVKGALAGGLVTGGVGWLGLVADIPVLIGLQGRIGLQTAAVYGYDTTDEHERALLIRGLELAETFGEDRRVLINEMLLSLAVAKTPEIKEKVAQLGAALVARGVAPAAARAVLQRSIAGQMAQYVARRGAQYGTAISASRYALWLVDWGVSEWLIRDLVKRQSGQLGRWIAERTAGQYAEKLLARKMMAAVPIVGAVMGGAFNAWFTNRNAKAYTEFYHIRYLCDHYDAYDALGLARPDVDALMEELNKLNEEDLAAQAKEAESKTDETSDQ